MKDSTEIINFNLVVNFILFILMIIAAIFALLSEKEYSSLKYSPEKKDRFCYPDIMCAEPSSSQNSNAIFSIAPYNQDFDNQNIIFQYYNNNQGVSEQVYNIDFTTAVFPEEVILYNGLCAGYFNYSSTGTSIYLYHYYKDNGASWDTNKDDIAGLLQIAFEGTSSYNYNENKLYNTNDEYLVYSLNNTLSGLSIYNTSENSLFNTTVLNIEPVYGQTNNLVVSNVIGYYRNAIKIIKHSETDTGTSHKRCIDPSYASKYICGIHHDSSDNKNLVYYNENVKLYVSSDNINKTSGITVCKLTSGEDPTVNSCGVPFCYAGTNEADNYQKNQFSVNGSVKNTNNQQDILYKNKSVVEQGLYDSSNTFNNAPQAQKLLFCGGTKIGNNNITDTPMTDNNSSYPTSYNISNTPELATQPNAKISGNKVILGFK